MTLMLADVIVNVRIHYVTSTNPISLVLFFRYFSPNVFFIIKIENCFATNNKKQQKNLIKVSHRYDIYIEGESEHESERE